MRLSAIILACEALGEPDPETNVEKVERAKCVADGVMFTGVLAYSEREKLEEEIEMTRLDLNVERADLDTAKDEIERLRGLLTKAGIKF